MAEESVVPQKRKPARRLTGLERKQLAGRPNRTGILDYIARNQHLGLNRSTIINGVSGSKAAFRGSIAKTLGRLIHDGYLEESVTIADNPPSRRDTQGGRRHRGYVGVNLDPTSIRVEAENAKASGKLTHHPGDRPTSQEEVVAKIAFETPEWKTLIKESELGSGGRKPREATPTWPHEIILLDVAITHGAGRDLLISVSYQNQDEFMRYVRKFIQMIPHVTNTQTELVAIRASEAEELQGKE